MYTKKLCYKCTACRVISVKLYLRDGRTDGRTKRRDASLRLSVRSFVCLFVRCVCHGPPSYGGI